MLENKHRVSFTSRKRIVFQFRFIKVGQSFYPWKLKGIKYIALMMHWFFFSCCWWYSKGTILFIYSCFSVSLRHIQRFRKSLFHSTRTYKRQEKKVMHFRPFPKAFAILLLYRIRIQISLSSDWQTYAAWGIRRKINEKTICKKSVKENELWATFWSICLFFWVCADV